MTTVGRVLQAKQQQRSIRDCQLRSNGSSQGDKCVGHGIYIVLDLVLRYFNGTGIPLLGWLSAGRAGSAVFTSVTSVWTRMMNDSGNIAAPAGV